MSDQEDPGLDELAPALGAPRPVRRLASSPRSRVWLYEFGRQPAIVKQITGGTGAAARFGREVTALRLAGHARPPVVPALLGTVPGTLTIVLHRTAIVAALAGEHPRLAATGELCRDIHEAMRRRWPGLEPPPVTRAHIS